jgi:hypothetical protein
MVLCIEGTLLRLLALHSCTPFNCSILLLTIDILNAIAQSINAHKFTRLNFFLGYAAPFFAFSRDRLWHTSQHMSTAEPGHKKQPIVSSTDPLVIAAQANAVHNAINPFYAPASSRRRKKRSGDSEPGRGK